ncbi:hypothetical protein C8K44_103238 [Aminobacter sp. AP02]|nr:hypothetical protein C8K44_103238 [Aminobacter sp. AP02]
MYTKTVVGMIVALAAWAAPASAQDLKKFGTEAGWDIFIKPDMGPGCVISKKLNSEAQFQMGIDATAEKRGYMALYTKADANVSAGDSLEVIFDVDGEKFSGAATGQQIDGMKGAFVWVNNPEFIYDLAKKKNLTISPAGRQPIVLPLTGTDAAFKSLRACQEAQ